MVAAQYPLPRPQRLILDLGLTVGGERQATQLRVVGRREREAGGVLTEGATRGALAEQDGGISPQEQPSQTRILCPTGVVKYKL